MRQVTRNAIRAVGLAALAVGLSGVPATAGDTWPAFRGPTQQGHADDAKVPLKFSEAEHVKWKTAVPGKGWSSPVVWGDQVWMTTALDGGHSLRAVCVDKNSGKVVHDVELFHPDKPGKKHDFNSYASPTPAIEAGRVYVSFGPNGVACLDTASGQVVWKNTDLKFEPDVGAGSSPMLYRNLLVMHCDGTDRQFVVALDKETGKIAWKVDRTFDLSKVASDQRKAFSMPTLVTIDGQDQFVSVGSRRIYAYEPLTGKEIWWCDTPAGYSIAARPVYADGLLFVCTGHDRDAMLVLKPDGKGDVTASHIVWQINKGAARKASVLHHDGLLYMVTDGGIVKCYEARSGKQVWQQRIGTAASASPLFADGKVYVFADDGLVTVLRPGRSPEILAENKLDGRILASPAVVGDAMFLRTDTHLYRIEE